MFFNPLFKEFKSIIGAVPHQKQVTFRVKNIFDSVVFVLRKDGNEVAERFTMKNEGNYFSLSLFLEVGLYFYYFELSNAKYIGKGDNYDGVISDSFSEYQLTVYSSDYQTPNWLKGGVIYQIFPDRFCKSKPIKEVPNGKIFRENWGEIPYFLPNKEGEVLNNDFFGGDIKGIISKIDYISSLGVNCIYLNPIFSAYSNHRYDTANYLEIDPILGDINDFKQLIERANEYGIKVVLDGVFNHTGSDSVYFNKKGSYPELGAYQSKDSIYYNWFNFIEHPNKYESWWGIQTLPSTNKGEGGYKDYITGKDGVIEFYTKLGIGGWRLDVVDELPANFVKSIRKSAKKINKDAVVIGEVWEDASNKISYGVRREYFQGNELDSVMNYPLKNAIIDFVKSGNEKQLLSVVLDQIDHYPKQSLHSLMNILSTHDTFRLLSALADENVFGKSKEQMSKILLKDKQLEMAKNRLKIATLLQYTLCGVPCLYYGEEAGMQGYTDPLNRGCFPWGNEDADILAWYKFLGRIRKENKVFVDGDLSVIYANKGCFIFKRTCDENEILIAVNLGEEISLEFNGTLKELWSNKKFIDCINLSNGQFGLFVCE